MDKSVNELNSNSVLKEKSVTKRERECINGIIDGLSAKEIAKLMNISHRTVEKYIENLKFKLECRNLKQLIAVAMYNLKICQIHSQNTE